MESTPDVAKLSERELDSALLSVIQDLPDLPTQRKCRQRRLRGWTFILAAPFCVANALLPVPLPTWDWIIPLFWILTGSGLIAVGGWQVDKAFKEEEEISRILRNEKGRQHADSKTKEVLRRVK